MQWTDEENNIIKENFNKKTLIQIRDLLNEHKSCGYSAIRSHCQGLGLYRSHSKIRIPRKNTFNMEYWRIPNLINSYISGFLAADGCISMDKRNNGIYLKIILSIKDEIVIDNIIKELNYTGPKFFKRQKSPSSNNINYYVGIQVPCFHQNAEYLRQYYNIVPNKTKRLGPTNLNNLYLNYSYIIGYIDGDGTLGVRFEKKIPYLYFCSSSFAILEWVKNILDNNFPNELYSHRESPNIIKSKIDNVYSYRINGLRSAIIIDYLCQFPVPKLDRKWNNPAILDYIYLKKQQYPHLFKTLNHDEIKDLVP